MQAPKPQMQNSNQFTRLQGGTLPPVKHKSRRESQRAAFLVVLTVIILAMLLVSVMIFAARCVSGSIGGEDTLPAETTPTVTTPTVTEPPVTTAPEPETTALASTYELKSCDITDLHNGYQILVNYQNAFVFDTSEFKLKPFYGNKNSSYKVSSVNVSFDVTALEATNELMAAFEAATGSHDLLINSSHRTFEEQEAIYAKRVDQYSEEYASMFVAVPGFSEHHTGLAVDLTVYTDKQEAMTLDDCPDYSAWLNENAHKYGFILRFPEDKIDITKIGYESWHFRYVGEPHAFYMKQNNLCLEEYIEALREFPYDGTHLKITDDEGQAWEIYFVKAVGETTDVPVPKYESYTISGNNVDGFIVTVRM